MIKDKSLTESLVRPAEGIPADNQAYVRQMLDLLALAFWTDATRVATFMLDHGQSNRYFNFIDGVQGTWHALSQEVRSSDGSQNSMWSDPARWKASVRRAWPRRIKRRAKAEPSSGKVPGPDSPGYTGGLVPAQQAPITPNTLDGLVTILAWTTRPAFLPVFPAARGAGTMV